MPAKTKQPVEQPVLVTPVLDAMGPPLLPNKRRTPYNEALMRFNEGRPNYSFVKKGTPEYDQVKIYEAEIKEKANKSKE
tara:strand:- start:193 stop:429 length:237 start_codon:yes stop_codon:yes gene_type:complete